MVELNPRVLGDLPVAPTADHTARKIRTGTWKYVQPRYRDASPPCSNACPAGNDISGFIHLLTQGRVEEAAMALRAGNPLPATLGRVCPHPCEGACNRETLGGAIAVHLLERFLGDQVLADRYRPQAAPPSGNRVAVIGAGPAGIAAAYNLALAGHAVDVYDDKPEPGGYLRTGIPEYRLPREVLDAEIRRVEQTGVRFNTGVRVGRDVEFDELRQRYDAVLVAVGFHGSRPLGVPGEDHRDVYNGVQLLERILLGERPLLPRRVAVVGGGNTAMDVARVLLRLHVEPVVVYRRTRDEMPAIASEVAEAEAEGIEFIFLAAPVRVVTEHDAITALECQRMQLGEPDASGRRRPEPIPGSEFMIPVQGVVTAIGELAELSFLPAEVRDGWRIAADPRLATSIPGVFAAGDAESGAGTVTAAVGAGRRAARMIDIYLQGDSLPDAAPEARRLAARDYDRDRVVAFEDLNVAYFKPAPRPAVRELAPAARVDTFAEVIGGLGYEEAIAEARRCLLCGTCNECENCLNFCPDIAIHRRAGGGFEIDLDHCKGCGICVEECPRGAILLEEVAP